MCKRTSQVQTDALPNVVSKRIGSCSMEARKRAGLKTKKPNFERRWWQGSLIRINRRASKRLRRQLIQHWQRSDIAASCYDTLALGMHRNKYGGPRSLVRSRRRACGFTARSK